MRDILLNRRFAPVTRRTLLGTAAAAGAASILPAFARDSFAQAGPSKGGHLVLGLDGASATDSLDPATYLATYMYTVGFQWGNCLVELDENNALVPELAESWEPNADATEWVLKIRRNVEFHNGKSLTAADVVHSLNHHRDEQSQSAARGLLTPVTDIRATDTHEVTVFLESPNVDLVNLLSDWHLMILPEDAAPDSGIGTGAFVIEQFDPGVRTVASLNRNYWKEGRGHVASVETVAMNDPSARTNAILGGSIHFMNQVDPKTVVHLERSSDVDIIVVPSAGHYVFPMRCDTAPFDNVDMRLALKYAIDREEIVRQVLAGFGQVGNDHPIPRFDPQFAEDVPQREYDPDRARHHFERSGHDGPIVLNASEAAFTGAVDAATLFREQAARAGISIDVRRAPSDGYWSDTWMVEPFSSSYWAGRATADAMLSAGYHSAASWNESFWRNPDFDRLLVQARGELDEGRRKEMYRDLQFMISEDAGALIPMFNDYLFAASTDLAGFVHAPVMTGARVAEQVHFDA